MSTKYQAHRIYVIYAVASQARRSFLVMPKEKVRERGPNLNRVCLTSQPHALQLGPFMTANRLLRGYKICISNGGLAFMYSTKIVHRRYLDLSKSQIDGPSLSSSSIHR